MNEPQTFKGGFTAEQLRRIADDAINRAQQSTSGPLVAHPIEFLAEDGITRLDVSRYQYQPFPKAMYGPGGQMRVVNNQAEMAKLSKDWSSTPKPRPRWDVRKIDQGYTLNDHHLAFFNSLDFGFADLAEATVYFKELDEEAQIEFLRDAEDWVAPEAKEVKRGPGRPPKDQVAS